MEKYELLYIIPAKFTDAEIDTLVKKISGLVTNAGATISGTHNLGKRKLAYPIDNVRTGHYVLTFFESETAVAYKLNDVFRLSTDILRHLLTVRDPHITAIPSLIEEEVRATRDDESPRRPAPAPARPIAPATEKPITMEELDKKLDEILTEEIL